MEGIGTYLLCRCRGGMLRIPPLSLNICYRYNVLKLVGGISMGEHGCVVKSIIEISGAARKIVITQNDENKCV